MKRIILLIVLVIILNLSLLVFMKDSSFISIRWEGPTAYEVIAKSSTSMSGLTYDAEINAIMNLKKAKVKKIIENKIPVYVEFEKFDISLNTESTKKIDSSNGLQSFINNETIKKIEDSIFLVVFNNNGAIDKIYSNPEIPNEISKSIEQLFYSAEIILPTSKKSNWNEFSEFNNEVSELSFSFNEDYIVKKKISTSKDNFNYKILDSEYKIKLSDRFWVDNITGYETYEIESSVSDKLSGYMKVDFKTTTYNINSKLKDFNKTYEDYLKEYKKLKGQIFDKKRNNPTSNIDIAYNQISNNFIKNKNEALNNSFKDLRDNSNKSYFNMVGLLLKYPELMENIPNLIKGYGSKEDNASRMIIGILESIGTDAAQVTIANILQDKEISKINRMRAAVALNGVKNPTDKTIDFLLKQISVRDSEDEKVISDTSYLALGSVGSKLFNGESEKYLDIKNRILEDLESDSIPKNIVLSSVGNTEDKSLYSVVSNYFNSNVLEDKIAAINSAGKLDNKRFGASAASLLEKENNQAARAETYKVLLNNRNDEVVNLMIKNVSLENEISRKSIINYFSKNIDIPEIEEKAKKISNDGILQPNESIEIRKALRSKEGLIVD